MMDNYRANKGKLSFHPTEFLCLRRYAKKNYHTFRYLSVPFCNGHKDIEQSHKKTRVGRFLGMLLLSTKKIRVIRNIR